MSGNKELKVTITPEHIATIEVPGPYWNGEEEITFMATDTKGVVGSETVNFTVASVNNPPEVKRFQTRQSMKGKPSQKSTSTIMLPTPTVHKI